MYYPFDYLKNIYKLYNILNTLPKEIAVQHLQANCNLYKIVAEIGRPRIYDNTINLIIAEEFKHKNLPFESFTPQTKSTVEKMLFFIREVFCSNTEQSVYFSNQVWTRFEFKKVDKMCISYTELYGYK